MFLASVVLTLVTFIINAVVFANNQNGQDVDPSVVIIICSVAISVVALPVIIFFIFHIYLSLTGKTTREVIKKIKGQNTENQWCKVD